MMEYWKNRLSNPAKKQYDILLKGIKRQAQSVDLPITENIAGELQKIYQCVLYDHPELFYASPQIAAMMSSVCFTVRLSYLYDTKQKCDIDRSLDALRCDLQKTQNKSEREKIYSAIYLLMRNSRYEINNLYHQNAASAIHYHTAQCSGFALAFKFAMDFLGIFCIVVSGSVSNNAQSGPHAWNIVKLNGSYYHLDITALANENLTEFDQLLRYRLFESDSQKKQQGCIWDESSTPRCSETLCPTNVFGGVENLPPENHGKPSEPNKALPTFTRLFDVQSKIRECIKNKTTYYEFVLEIPAYSNEKLMRMIMNDVKEQGKALSASFAFEVGCVSNKIYIKFNYKN